MPADRKLGDRKSMHARMQGYAQVLVHTYKDTHMSMSAVNAENDSGIFPVRPLRPRYLQSKQARLVVDKKGRIFPQGDLQSTW